MGRGIRRGKSPTKDRTDGTEGCSGSGDRTLNAFDVADLHASFGAELRRNST